MRRLARALAAVVLVVCIGDGQKFFSFASGATQVRQERSYRAAAKFSVRVRGRTIQVGTASWYGQQYNGKITASGESFDMYAFTAAHPNLPLGTRVRVTNLQNGTVVMVRINDRGPLPRGRIIDLSSQF
jgi:rare lipoprotein A (peptidoglycan hydrolase)